LAVSLLDHTDASNEREVVLAKQEEDNPTAQQELERQNNAPQDHKAARARQEEGISGEKIGRP
jgi:hypothetical protein